MRTWGSRRRSRPTPRRFSFEKERETEAEREGIEPEKKMKIQRYKFFFRCFTRGGDKTLCVKLALCFRLTLYPLLLGLLRCDFGLEGREDVQRGRRRRWRSSSSNGSGGRLDPSSSSSPLLLLREGPLVLPSLPVIDLPDALCAPGLAAVLGAGLGGRGEEGGGGPFCWSGGRGRGGGGRGRRG